MAHGIYWGFSNNIVFLYLKIDFVLPNSADPDEMPHYAAFHLGLHCLPEYPGYRGLMGFNSTRGECQLHKSYGHILTEIRAVQRCFFPGITHHFRPYFKMLY